MKPIKDKSDLVIIIIFIFFVLLSFYLFFFIQPSPKHDFEDNTIPLSPAIDDIILTPYIVVYEDAEGNLDIEQISDPSFQFNFVRIDTYSYNAGFTDSVYWVKFKLINHSSSSIWYLEQEVDYIDYIDFYCQDSPDQPASQFIHKQNGRGYPFSVREIQSHNTFFRININQGESKSIYLRFKSIGPMTITLRLKDVEHYMSGERHDLAFKFFILGILLAMVFHSFVLYIYFKDSLYLYYSFFLLVYSAYIIVLHQIPFEFLWPEVVYWNRRVIQVLVLLASISALKIGIVFLKLKVYSKLLYHIAIGLMILFFLILPLDFIVFINEFDMLYPISWMVASVYLLFASIISLSKGYELAKYFLVAFFITLLGGSIYVSYILGLLPPNIFIDNILLIGLFFHYVIIYIGVSKRINRINEEIHNINATIHNSIKNKIDSIRNVLDLYLKGKTSSLEDIHYVSKLAAFCSSESQSILYVTKHSEITMEELIDEFILRAELALKLEGIDYFIHKPRQNTIIRKDNIQYLLEVFTESLNNIVKHSEANQVEIVLDYQQKILFLAIKDNGIGFNPRAIKFGHNHCYGLKIIQQLTSDRGAYFEISSEADKGTQIFVKIKN